MKHTENKPLKAPHSGLEFDPADTLECIQGIIRTLEFDHTDENKVYHDSDVLKMKIATFNTIMEALHFWYVHEGGDEYMDDKMFTAIQMNWWELKKTIDIRHEEYNRVTKLAIHGTEDPLNTGKT